MEGRLCPGSSFPGFCVGAVLRPHRGKVALGASSSQAIYLGRGVSSHLVQLKDWLTP